MRIRCAFATALLAVFLLIMASCAAPRPSNRISPSAQPPPGQVATAEPSAGEMPESIETVETTAEPEEAKEAEEPIVEPDPYHIRIAFAGDVLLFGRVAGALEARGHDAIIEPELAKLLSESDLAFVNLEMSISNRGEPMEDKQFTFRGKPEYLSLLTDAMGISAVSLANNHSLDFGADAFLDTMAHLTSAGIGYAGAGQNLAEASAPWSAEIQGRSVAILAASRVIPTADWNASKTKPGILTTYDPGTLNRAIATAKQEYDYVVVFVHWGKESVTELEDHQITLARGYIDAGADAVIGSHPHILQGFEIYRGKPIAYSLGNFIFTASRPETCVAILNITEDALWLEVVPCTIDSPYTRLVADPAKARERLNGLEGLSPDVRFDDSGKLLAIVP